MPVRHARFDVVAAQVDQSHNEPGSREETVQLGDLVRVKKGCGLEVLIRHLGGSTHQSHQPRTWSGVSV